MGRIIKEIQKNSEHITVLHPFADVDKIIALAQCKQIAALAKFERLSAQKRNIVKKQLKKHYPHE